MIKYDMIFFFLQIDTNNNVDRICYIHYIHLMSLEAGGVLMFRQFIVCMETLRRTIGFLLPAVAFLFLPSEADPGRGAYR